MQISFGGIVSGIDTNGIIDQLSAIARQPIDRLENQKIELQNRVSAFQTLSVQLLDLKVTGLSLNTKLKVGSHTVASSDESILTATVAGSPDIGTHSVRVNQLARGEESLSQGVKAVDSKIVGTGSLNIKAGNGTDDLDLNESTKISFLNNGTLSSLGSIEITDRSGSVATIDLSTADTVQDVLDLISGNSNVDVTATLNEDGTGILIQDNTGSTNNLFKILESGVGTTAEDLGIKTPTAGVNANQVVGTDLDPLYSIAIDETNNTLEGIRDAINSLNGPFSASIINTGSTTNPFRLSIVSKNTGTIGALTFSSTADPIVNELVGTGDGTLGSTKGDYALSTSPIGNVADVTAVTVGGVPYTVRAEGGNTGVGFEVEVDINSGELQFFTAGVATNVTGEIRASYTPQALAFTEIQTAQDAEIELGSNNPITINKHKNVITDVISGLSLNLVKADSSKLIQLSVNSDVDDLLDTVKNFIGDYNAIVDNIQSQNTFDAEAGLKGGPLFGDPGILTVLSQLQAAIAEPVDGLPASLNSIFQIGITPGSNGKLNVDDDALRDKLTNNLSGVRDIFAKTRNIASSATLTASSIGTGYDVNDLVNGETSSSNFGPLTQEGYQDNTANTFSDFINFAFDKPRLFNQIDIYTLDSLAQPAAAFGIRDYEVQYLKIGGNPSVDEDFITIASATNNQDGKRTHFFNITTQNIRLKIDGVNAADGFSKLVEVETYEASGVALRLDNIVSGLTDINTGIIPGFEDGINDEIDFIDNRIETLESRVEREIERLRTEFTKMEEILSSLQTTSTFLASQLGALSFGQQ